MNNLFGCSNIEIALQGVGNVYDDCNKPIGKFLVNTCFNKISKFVYIAEYDGIDYLWQSANILKECKPKLNLDIDLPENIQLIMNICDARGIKFLDGGLGYDPNPKKIGELIFYYYKINNGVYKISYGME